MTAPPNWAGVWIVAITLPLWLVLASVLIPWEAVRQIRRHPAPAAVSLLLTLAAGALVWLAPRFPLAYPLGGERLIRLAAFVLVTGLGMWLQRFLDLRLGGRMRLERVRASN
jgi:hypothetical protein